MLAAFLLAMVAQEPGPSREERVLELLRTLEREEGSWRYLYADFLAPGRYSFYGGSTRIGAAALGK